MSPVIKISIGCLFNRLIFFLVAVFDTAIIVGILEHVFRILDFELIVPLESNTTLTGFLPLAYLTVRIGSSSRTVLIPTKIASTLERSL